MYNTWMLNGNICHSGVIFGDNGSIKCQTTLFLLHVLFLFAVRLQSSPCTIILRLYSRFSQI
jgi:hypothetical protein